MNAATTRVVAPIVVGVLLVALWWVATAFQGKVVLVPTPPMVVEATVASFGQIVQAAGVTALNALIGLVVGVVVGVAAAGVAAWLRAVDWMLAPIVAAVAVVPIVALAPILNNLYGSTNQFSRVAVAAIAAFVPIFVNVLRGLRLAPPVQRDLFRAYAAGGGQTFRRLTLPTAVPHLMTGLRIASSLAVISALVAEYFGGPREGLGTAIASYAKVGKAALAFGHVGAAIVVGLIFFLATLLVERLVSRRIPA